MNIFRKIMMHKGREKIMLLTGLGIVVLSGGVLFYKDAPVIQNASPKQDLISLKAPLEQTSVTALLETKTASHPLSGQVLATGATFNPEDVLAAPYKISLTLGKDGHYRDLILSVNKTRSAFFVQAGGFSPDDKITLTMNDQPVYQNIRFDWSGHLQLTATVPDGGNVTACLSVLSSENGLDVCHAIPEGRAI